MFAPPFAHRKGWPSSQTASGPPACASGAHSRRVATPAKARERLLLVMEVSLPADLGENGRGEPGVCHRSFRALRGSLRRGGAVEQAEIVELIHRELGLVGRRVDTKASLAQSHRRSQPA